MWVVGIVALYMVLTYGWSVQMSGYMLASLGLGLLLYFFPLTLQVEAVSLEHGSRDQRLPARHMAPQVSLTGWCRWTPKQVNHSFELECISSPTIPHVVIAICVSIALVISGLGAVFLEPRASLGLTAFVMFILFFLSYRAFVFHPFRTIGRWAIIADPQQVEIPNWLHGARTYAWHEHDLIVVGIFGAMARVCLIDQSMSPKVTLTIPKSGLKRLVGVYMASRINEEVHPDHGAASLTGLRAPVVKAARSPPVTPHH